MNGRNLYVKRFEEAWFSYKLKNWIFRGGLPNASQLSLFDAKNIETEIGIYFTQIHEAFVNYWYKHHQNHCKNHDVCKAFSKYANFYLFKNL